MEVRSITKKISDLNCKLDTVSNLSEPRENFYIEFAGATAAAAAAAAGSADEDKSGDAAAAAAAAAADAAMKSLICRVGRELQSGLGTIKTSRTLPSFCRCTMETVIAHLEASAVVRTVDYEGNPQRAGGDPVRAEVLDDKGERVPVRVRDRDDGSYEVRFTAHRPSTYCLKVSAGTRRTIICAATRVATGYSSSFFF